MITLLDCIQRIPDISRKIIDSYDEIYKQFLSYIQEKDIDELIFIGSGTSNTSTITACNFVERITKIRVSHYIPNEFLNKEYFNCKGLYIFVSQSGTSRLTNQSLEFIKKKGLFHACICADAESKMVRLSDCFIDLSCGEEEYGMRTIGYVSTILVEMFLGIAFAKSRNIVADDEVNFYLDDALKAVNGLELMTNQALIWFETNKEYLNSVEGFLLYGGKALWGVALEGALKILEITRQTLAIGYEIDDGCHGPTMGFTKKHAVIAFNIDDENNDTVQKLTDYAKNELGFGSIIGNKSKDLTDLKFEHHSNHFYAIEFAPFVQILAYQLAIEKGVVLEPSNVMKPLPEKKYFNMHEK